MIAKRKHGGARAGAGRRPGPPSRAVRLPVPIADLACKLAAARKGGDVASLYRCPGAVGIAGADDGLVGRLRDFRRRPRIMSTGRSISTSC